MKPRTALLLAPTLLALAFAPACGSEREVAVTGGVRANAVLSNAGLRTVLVAEPPADGAAHDTLLGVVHLPEDDHTFATTVAMTGHTLHLYVFADHDESGTCNGNDATGRATMPVPEDATSVDVELTLGEDPHECPVFED